MTAALYALVSCLLILSLGRHANSASTRESPPPLPLVRRAEPDFFALRGKRVSSSPLPSSLLDPDAAAVPELLAACSDILALDDSARMLARAADAVGGYGDRMRLRPGSGGEGDGLLRGLEWHRVVRRNGRPGGRAGGESSLPASFENFLAQRG